MGQDAWESDTEIASVQPDGEAEVLFHCCSREKKGGNRAPERPRPYRNSTKSDRTGYKADLFDVDTIFNDRIREDGDGPGRMWPDRIEAFERALKSQRVLTLHLPWERNIRCVAVDWTRIASAHENRVGERMSVTFRHDNEDTMGTGIELVSIRAAVQQVVRDAIFDLERQGISMPQIPATFDAPTLDETIDDLHRAAADLDAALSAPQDFRGDVENKAYRLKKRCERVRTTFSGDEPGRDGGNDPSGEASIRKLRQTEELADKARGGAVASRPRKVKRRYQTTLDIFTIASIEGQNPSRLVEINGHLEDMTSIPPRTLVFIELEPLSA